MNTYLVKQAVSGYDVGAMVAGLGVLGLGAQAVRDAQRGFPGMEDDIKTMQDLFSKEQSKSSLRVPSKVNDRPVVVISDPKDVKQIQSRGDGPLKTMFIRGMSKAILKEKINAAAIQGPRSTDYLVIPTTTPKEFVQHEIGHLKEPDSMDSPSLLSNFIRKRYDREVMDRERGAWSHVSDTRRRKEVEEFALGTYDKSFYAQRGVVSGLGAIALANIAMSFIKAKKGL